jgi:glycoside/pentoside/hexuronide:cation symporter, GPH family
MSVGDEARLPLRVLLSYGWGSLAVYVAPMITAFFLSPFLLEVAEIDAGAAGSILLFGNIFDAFSDPTIGFLSDKTPWGPRRLPWIGFASLPFIYFYTMLWLVPPFNEAGLIVYYTIVYICRTLALTCITIPYNSLSAELTQSYDERSRLVGSRYIITITRNFHMVLISNSDGSFPYWLEHFAWYSNHF